MWISTGRLALAALALGTAEAAGAGSVQFTTGFEGGFGNTAEAILDYRIAVNRPFVWTAWAGASVDKITLYTYNDETKEETPLSPPWSRRATDAKDNPSQTSSTVSTTSTSVSDTTLGARQNQNEGLPDGQAVGLSVIPDAHGGAVSIIGLSVLDNTALFFKAEWSTGTNYSRLFVVVQSDPLAAAQRNKGIFNDPNPHHDATTFLAVTSTSAATAPTSGVTGTALDGGTGKGTTAQSSGGGLSSGAVIGIAVACGVIGLALIGGLIWFLLRRRQQKKPMLPVDSFSSGNRREELMAEKEANADVDVSPHSPYSDDGAAGASGGNGSYHETAALTTEGAVAGAAASHRQLQQDQARSFTPYSDRPIASGAAAAAAVGTAIGTPSVRAASVAQNDEAHVSIPSATPGRATPRALSTPYAHLVEDGMTEDEIRRLEDEERQLDAAIEQAGRR